MSDYNLNHKPSKLSDKINEMHADRREDDFTQPIRDNGAKKKRIYIIVAIAVLVIIIGILTYLLLKKPKADDASATTEISGLVNADNKQQNADGEGNGKGAVSLEDLNRLELEQQLAQSQFENLEKEFKDMELPASIKIKDDKVKKQLQEQYNKARLEVEELRKQLKDIKNKNSQEVQDLLNQIQTLRDLIKHYLEIIESQDKTIKEQSEKISNLESENSQLKSNVQQTQAQNQELQGRMTLAEKLNVTDVSMGMLNKKGKNETKVKNARQFVINFAIPQNVSTPVGTKTIYAVITTPEGQTLEGGGNFVFEGSTIPASASLNVDYGGEEIGGLKMYYDINQALTTGEYTFQLFCDGYELMKTPRRVSFNK